MEKHINTLLLAIIAILLGAIAYSTGQGKIFPEKEPLHMTCDSFLTQRLFYSDFFGTKGGDTHDLSENAKHASSIEELHKLIADNTKFDVNNTEFYSSLTNASSCQAYIKLKQPDDEGTTAIYVPYTISGFAPTNAAARDNDLIENIQMNILDLTKEK